MLLPPDAATATRIEVYRIGPAPAGSGAGEPTVIGEWHDAGEVLALLAAVPPAGIARCFSPRFGLSAFAGGSARPVFRVALCWSCRRALFSGPGVTPWQGMDPGSAPAAALLARLKACEAEFEAAAPS
ncbi:hypothetical protein [Kitasatospora sp. NBC_01539]|uniref:hypothetical protein n=1 Tax=Kitasatospora sp. NBC_01539 TaxID=2903577 RepID=UPI00386023EF